MKKIILVLALICFLSFASASEFDPYTKEDFRQKMDRAMAYNRQNVPFPYLDPFLEGTEEYKMAEERTKELVKELERLDVLKEEAKKEYDVFYDAYYASDSEKVKTQVDKLKVIFDEMNSLMSTIVRFEGIYNDILYWSIQLDYLIEQGVFDPNQGSIDNSGTFTPVQEKTGTANQVTDCCIAEPEGECCKAKKSAECCAKDPNSDCCKEKPVEDDLLVPIAVALIVFVLVIVVLFFIRR